MKRYLFTCLLLLIGTASFAQNYFNSLYNSQLDELFNNKNTIQESNRLLFEDIFGRLYNGFTTSLDYRYNTYEFKSKSSSSIRRHHKFEYHSLLLGAAYGNRDSYDVGFRSNITGEKFTSDKMTRYHGFHFNWRPLNGFQIYNSMNFRSSRDQSYKHNYDINSSFIYLSNGQIDAQSPKIEHYLYLKDILLNKNQVLFSFTPLVSFFIV